MEETINPFRQLREQADLTLGELATYAKVDIRALTRSEHGMYKNPLPALVDYWVRRGITSEGVLTTQYEDYRLAVRRHNHRVLGPTLTFSLTSNIHPLRQLRATHQFGLVDFCKTLCLSLDSVQFFEKKWRTQQSVPKELLLALNQAGYSRLELREFSANYSKWRANQTKIVFSEVGSHA